MTTAIKELVQAVKQLKRKELNEVLDFAHFLKMRSSVDPGQTYFWTKKWQTMESLVDQDKARERIIGDGTVGGLLKALKKHSHP